MKISLKNITKEEFNKSTAPILFKDTIANHRMALVTNDQYTFRLAWHSDLIDPVITEINSNVFGIGIDQNFAVIDFNMNKSLINLSLTYNFFDTIVFDNWFFIITELEILKVHRITLKIFKQYQLPDIFEEISFIDNQIEVRCSGNNTILLT